MDTAVFQSRRRGYQAGFGLLIVATVLHIVGFSSPDWLFVGYQYLSKQNWDKTRLGLWTFCANVDGNKLCGSLTDLPFFAVVGWFKAVQAMECLALICLVAASAFGAKLNFCRNVKIPVTTTIKRLLEALTGLGGLFGFIGTMVFLGKLNDSVNDSESGTKFYWAFQMTIGSSVTALVAALLLAVNTQPRQPQSGMNSGQNMGQTPGQNYGQNLGQNMGQNPGLNTATGFSNPVFMAAPQGGSQGMYPGQIASIPQQTVPLAGGSPMQNAPVGQPVYMMYSTPTGQPVYVQQTPQSGAAQNVIVGQPMFVPQAMPAGSVGVTPTGQPMYAMQQGQPHAATHTEQPMQIQNAQTSEITTGQPMVAMQQSQPHDNATHAEQPMQAQNAQTSAVTTGQPMIAMQQAQPHADAIPTEQPI